MCGKTDTVQLLLDKGTNLELKDSQGRTVLDLLAEYPADKAKEICRMIQSRNWGRRGEVSFNTTSFPCSVGGLGMRVLCLSLSTVLCKS